LASPEKHILVVGAGSIGRRHATNMLAAGALVDITDPDPAKATPPSGVSAIDYAGLGALRGYDGIVIASPSTFHAAQLRWALDAADRVLVEKPLATAVGELDQLADIDADRVMVGYNLRFHPPVLEFVHRVRAGEVGRPLAVRAWFGSYLPDWRPGVDYRRTYSARADLGGGILLDGIHELDLLLWLLPGEFEVAGAIVGRFGDLEIDVEDTVKAALRCGGTAVELSLDYLSRSYRRGLDVVGTDGNLRLDWATGTIELETPAGSTSMPALAEVGESYVREGLCFLAWLSGGARPPVLGAEGARSVRLAEEIRRAAL